MSHRRTVIVDEIHYQGTDGEDHIAHKGDKVVVSTSGVEHFDTFQASSPEGRWAEFLRANSEKVSTEKPADPEAKKA